MAFLTKITPLSPGQGWPDAWYPDTHGNPQPMQVPSYTLHFKNSWSPTAVDPEPWADPHPILSGTLVLSLDYEDGSTNGSREETADGAARLAEADERVQDLLNLLAEALDGTDWVLGNGRKVTATYQQFSPDEPPVE